ncbi:Anthranilate phosphoribosyltransferase [Paenochrobactrum sp. BZR 201-1]
MAIHSPYVSTTTLASKAFLDGQPTPQQLATQLENLTQHNDPAIRFSRFLGIIGRGSGNSRPLSIEEADEAFSLILEGRVDPLQLGSFLSLIHYRGTSAQELAGMIYATRRFYDLDNPNIQRADLDWPAYLSPNSQRAPWFMQAAKLLAQAGYKIALHGNNGTGANSGKIEKAARALDIPIACNVMQASQNLAANNIVYLPLPAFAPHLGALNALYPLFAARSPVGDCVHLINPLQAHASLLGVSRPAYRELHRDTINLMIEQQKNATLYTNSLKQLNILSGNRDVAEFFPFRDTTILNLTERKSADIFIQALKEPEAHPRIAMDSFEYWYAIWQGTAIDKRLETVITATATLGLMTLQPSEPFETCHLFTKKLWQNRHNKP